MFQTILRLGAWCAIVTIGVLSLLPTEMRPPLPGSGHLQHVAAFLITVTLFSLGYPRRSPIVIIALFSTYAASLEIAQHFAPGRHPAILDWIFGSLGVLIGAVVATLIMRLWLRSPDAIEKKAGTDKIGP